MLESRLHDFYLSGGCAPPVGKVAPIAYNGPTLVDNLICVIR